MDESYEGREQSAAKHLILERYLEKLAYKVGFARQGTLNYVDGFAGPWESKKADLSDTSPFLAVNKLVEVRKKLAAHNKQVDVRAFFVSPTASDAKQLLALRGRFPNATLEVAEKTFEAAITDACRFAAFGRDAFAFIFIDHTGWTGFGLSEITPLLRTSRNEVLINFMTGHITRFIDSEDSRYEQSFIDLFGDASYRGEWRGLTGLDREDRIVETYCQRVAKAGNYKHCVSSVILKPNADRSHFHLVYGTRSDEGLATFREIERAGIKFQRTQRADAQQRVRFQRSGQKELFAGSTVVARTYEDELRERYVSRATAELERLTNGSAEILWDDLVIAALQVPMIAESDVKSWLAEKQRTGALEVLGLREKARVPKRGQKHRIRRLGSAS